MRRIHTSIMIIAACGALAACGSRQPLKQKEGAPPVPVALGAEDAATSGELMEPSAQARPDRSAEPLKRSQEREDDPFDMLPN